MLSHYLLVNWINETRYSVEGRESRPGTGLPRPGGGGGELGGGRPGRDGLSEGAREGGSGPKGKTAAWTNTSWHAAHSYQPTVTDGGSGVQSHQNFVAKRVPDTSSVHCGPWKPRRRPIPFLDFVPAGIFVHFRTVSSFRGAD
ncbi:hypothetical protein KM043_014968 [Ampulex compressa]|nr:hypothetical protein KM043_014968 [Ampulex compressa]